MQRQKIEKAFLDGMWAIEPHWLQQAWSVIHNTHDKTAFAETQTETSEETSILSAIKGIRPEGTFYTLLPNKAEGVAVIEIWGAIFPRANWMTYYSGGTSCDLLTRDIDYCLNNPAVESILFFVHSPGGEVTGISEVAEKIYKARNKKPMTAFAYGMMCSAAYWIGSACGDIVVSSTARVGSIGVYAVYTDDSKRLEMLGLKEIEFRNQTSPNKNLSLSEKQGRSLYQTQIDDLGTVFYQDIARNREIGVEEAIKQFGGGDCFIGKKAVKAGLADRVGSFEMSLASLNGEEVVWEFDDLDDVLPDDNEEESQTLNPENSLIFNQLDETIEKTNDEENTMSVETEEKVEKVEVQTAEEKSEYATLMDKINAQNAEIEKLRQESADKDLRVEVKEIVSEFTGNKSEKEEILFSLMKSFGKDSSVVKNYITHERASAEQLSKGDLFKELGKTGKETSASDELEVLAKAKMKNERLTYQQAVAKVLEEKPELYEG